ncbi:HNH endonuclease signature motif containing protein [Streptomyces californicus]|uniref:HNH endonuclease signature motif containing protein n=1 Tax=Streptomyces californicus TaxID=67351 RepID=UPI0035D64E33
MAELEARFWAKVEHDVHTPDRCWEWTASRTRGGYGLFGLPGKTALAHRLAYELERGPIPAGLDLDHRCRNRVCVNPWHLEPVTERENALRGEGPTALNARKTVCPEGHPYDEYETEPNGSRRRRCSQCRRRAARVRQQRYRNRQRGNT